MLRAMCSAAEARSSQHSEGRDKTGNSYKKSGREKLKATALDPQLSPNSQHGCPKGACKDFFSSRKGATSASISPSLLQEAEYWADCLTFAAGAAAPSEAPFGLLEVSWE